MIEIFNAFVYLFLWRRQSGIQNQQMRTEWSLSFNEIPTCSEEQSTKQFKLRRADGVGGGRWHIVSPFSFAYVKVYR